MKKYLDIAREKILSGEELNRMLAIWRFRGKSIVFTNGCFDILHRGHVEYLSHAASLGDILVIGLNTDESVRKLKGEGRPVQDEDTRALLLAMLPMVGAVALFNQPTPLELILRVNPDVLAKGGDYREEDIVGAEEVRQHGGKVEVIPFLPGHSTSEIIRKLKEQLP